MKTFVPAFAACAAASLFASSAGAVTVLVDDFSHGSTVVSSTTNGFGSTADSGIQAGFPTGDPARYYSWATGDGQSVTLNNQITPGVLAITHGGGGSSPYVNLSYNFSAPTDLSSFGTLNVHGEGQGPATVLLQLTDADGDVFSQTLTLGGVFGDLQASFASMTCLTLGGGSCSLNGITMIEYYVGGIGSAGFSQRIDSIDVASLGSGVPVTPIPEPETYALLALGLPLVAWASRRRAAKKV